MFGLNKEEMRVLKKYNNPKKIQDLLNSFKINFEERGETCMSPRMVLKNGKCHCIEGAFLAYVCFKLNGQEAWLVDLRATKDDFDHVICVFKKDGFYGCVSKSNHSAHRYREPIYRDVREIVMSIFHEYFDKSGRKTLRSFSVPVELDESRFKDWAIREDNLWDIAIYLNDVKHYNILNRKQIANLRKADKVEIASGNITEWKESWRFFV